MTLLIELRVFGPHAAYDLLMQSGHDNQSHSRYTFWFMCSIFSKCRLVRSQWDCRLRFGACHFYRNDYSSWCEVASLGIRRPDLSSPHGIALDIQAEKVSPSIQARPGYLVATVVDSSSLLLLPSRTEPSCESHILDYLESFQQRHGRTHYCPSDRHAVRGYRSNQILCCNRTKSFRSEEIVMRIIGMTMHTCDKTALVPSA